MFQDQLKRLKLTKAELADRLGLSANGVSKWGSNPPKYAQAYIDLLERHTDLKDGIREKLSNLIGDMR